MDKTIYVKQVGLSLEESDYNKLLEMKADYPVLFLSKISISELIRYAIRTEYNRIQEEKKKRGL